MVEGRCPYCNCPLDHYDRFGAEKHKTRCGKNPRRTIHTGKPPGRPSKDGIGRED